MALKKYYLYTLLLLFAMPGRTLAQDSIIPELSSSYIQKLIDTAKINYPKMKSYRSHILIAKSNIDKAKLSLLEALTVSYVYQPGQTTFDPTNPSTSYFRGFQTGIFLNLGTLIEKPFVTKAAKEELHIAQNDQDEYLLTLATDVKKRYYIYIQRVAELKLVNKAEQDAENSLADIKYKFEKGEETFDNYNKTQSDLTSRKISKIEAESSLFIAKADLEELLGTQLENVR